MSQKQSDADARDPALLPYFGGIGAWFLALGLHSVLVPTLAAIYLNVSASALGTMQMTLSLPQLLFLLYAGSVADRSNARSMLIVVHALAALPPMALLALIWYDALTYWNLLAYGLCVGTCLAFAGPTREALLMRVVKTNVSQGVMGALITQNLSQLAGYGLAALAAPIAGPWALPIFQALAVLVGLYFAFRLPSYPPAAQHLEDGKRLDWTSGLRIVFANERLYPVLLANLAVGILFVGVFIVSLPLLARDVFGGGQLEISIMNLSFWGGTIASTFFLMRSKPIHYRGRALSLAMIVGSVCLFFMVQVPSFAMFCALGTGWGIAAGVNMAMGRTIVQIETPEHSRARVMAIYNLGFIGAAPIGALTIGLLSEWVGIRTAPALSASAMVLFAIWFILATPAWRITRNADEG